MAAKSFKYFLYYCLLLIVLYGCYGLLLDHMRPKRFEPYSSIVASFVNSKFHKSSSEVPLNVGQILPWCGSEFALLSKQEPCDMLEVSSPVDFHRLSCLEETCMAFRVGADSFYDKEVFEQLSKILSNPCRLYRSSDFVHYARKKKPGFNPVVMSATVGCAPGGEVHRLFFLVWSENAETVQFYGSLHVEGVEGEAK